MPRLAPDVVRCIAYRSLGISAASSFALISQVRHFRLRAISPFILCPHSSYPIMKQNPALASLEIRVDADDRAKDSSRCLQRRISEEDNTTKSGISNVR